MLARLATIDGLIAVEVDHRGELLRLKLTTPALLDRVHSALHALGYRADVDPQPSGPDERWYGPAGVSELSREEAGVIAQRLVPPFARTEALSAGTADRLVAVVTRALHRCFIGHTLAAGAPPGELRTACSDAVRDAIQELIDADAVERFVAALGRDLAAGA